MKNSALPLRYNHDDGFRLYRAHDFALPDVVQVLEKRVSWVEQAPDGARVVILTTSPVYPNPIAIKFYPTVQCEDRRQWRKRNRLRQLGSRYAGAEARNYELFRRIGVATPRLLAWGERWRYGLRHEGVLVTEYVAAPTLDTLLKNGDTSWVLHGAEALAKLHNAGHVHLDCYPRNCFSADGGILMFDLETVNRFNPERQQRDLSRMFMPVLQEQGSPEAMLAGLERYNQLAHLVPNQDELLAYIERKRKKWNGGAHISDHARVINELGVG